MEMNSQESVHTYGHNIQEWGDSNYNSNDVKRGELEISLIDHFSDVQRSSE